MLLVKAVLLVWCFNTKMIFRVINLIFGLKIDFKNWKYLIFDCPQSSSLAIYKKNPLRKLIWMQKSTEFHLPHLEIPQLSSHNRVVRGKWLKHQPIQNNPPWGWFQRCCIWVLKRSIAPKEEEEAQKREGRDEQTFHYTPIQLSSKAFRLFIR